LSVYLGSSPISKKEREKKKEKKSRHIVVALAVAIVASWLFEQVGNVGLAP
jgi:hypothetical protein